MSPHKQVVTWKLALSSLERAIPVLLLYVLDSKGSSPGRQGFFMVVNALGEMEGSIGGGIMEHKFTEMAKDRLRQGGDVLALRRQIHDKETAKDQSGMICSGEQTILLYGLRPRDLETIAALVGSLERYRSGSLRLSPEGLRFDAVMTGEVGVEGMAPEEVGGEGMTPEEVRSDAGMPEEVRVEPMGPTADYRFIQRSEADWEYVEKTGYKDRLYIVGGGHCALAFSRLMRTMDFHITVFDHRPELETLIRNEYAHEKVLVEDYDELKGLIVSGQEHHYVVVMTQGYRTDDRAMRALLPLSFRYFGLLGSKAKVSKMMAGYREEGVAEEWLRKVRAPAGLPIHSQTPEEIAVSIAAEIVQEKHKD